MWIVHCSATKWKYTGSTASPRVVVVALRRWGYSHCCSSSCSCSNGRSPGPICPGGRKRSPPRLRSPLRVWEEGEGLRTIQ
eukprot:7673819-Prorocentrum_lima.AAC.1